MLSYALGTLTLGGPKKGLNRKPKRYLDYIRPEYNRVKNEIMKYEGGDSVPDSQEIKEILYVAVNRKMNIRLLVAANYWYLNNGQPKEFTPDLISRSNPYFNQVTEVLYDGNYDLWDKENLTSFFIYANYIRLTLFDRMSELVSSEIDEVIFDDEDDFFDS